jgi:hypothetical protein
MRIIEDKLTKIVQDCLLGKYTKSFSKSPSRRDRVEYDHEGSQVTVFLWNSAIVKVDTKEKRVILDSCNYHTNTTKSRLNAFIQQFDSQVGGIYQKNWTWYQWTREPLTETDKSVEFNGNYEFVVR